MQPRVRGEPTDRSESLSLSATQLFWPIALDSGWWQRLNPCAPISEGEAQYQAYKYHQLHGSHLFSCLCIFFCTIIFATIWWNDQYLEGTIFPQVLGPSPGPGPGPDPDPSPSPSPNSDPDPNPYPDPRTPNPNPNPNQVFSLRVGLYSLSVALEAGACVLFRFVKRSKRYAAFYHFFFGIWFITVLSFDPHRIVVLWDDSTTYAEELAKWWLAYEPDYDTSNCGGLVVSGSSNNDDGESIIGEQSCYFNSYESVYMIMIMGVMTVLVPQPRPQLRAPT